MAFGCEYVFSTELSSAQLTKANIFSKTFILIGMGWFWFELFRSQQQETRMKPKPRVLNPLGNIHKNQNKTPLKWIYFYCSMIFSAPLFGRLSCVLYYVCNLYHPKIVCSLISPGIKWLYEFLCRCSVCKTRSIWWRSWGCWTCLICYCSVINSSECGNG